jgi:Peptidase family M23
MRLLRRLACAALAGALLAPPAGAAAAGSVGLPFVGGQGVRIIQGYNGGTHQGRSRYGLDLVLAGGGTSGAPVVAPVDGLVSWSQAPGAGNGCLAIALRDGSFSVVLCHVLYEHAFRSGEAVAAGQPLGSVGTPGSLGNNGTPHVHLELHRGRGANNPLPFAAPPGLSLEGVDLPASGAANEHASRTLRSPGPAGASGGPDAAPPPAPVPRAPAPAPKATPPPASAAAPAASEDTPAPAQSAAALPAPGSPPAMRLAVVQGTGACLKVRDEPALDAATVDCLVEGAEVRLGERVEHADSLEWWQIPGQGWAAADFLRRTRAVVSGTDSCLNVRDVPSTLGEVLACIPEGVAVAIGESADSDLGDWRRVDASADRPAGWVLAGFLH